MTDSEQLHRLRRQRNFLAIAAVLMILISMGISLPRALDRQHKLKALNEELVGLHGLFNAILSAQQRTGEVQAEIVRTQNEIKVLLKQP